MAAVELKAESDVVGRTKCLFTKNKVKELLKS